MKIEIVTALISSIIITVYLFIFRQKIKSVQLLAVNDNELRRLQSVLTSNKGKAASKFKRSSLKEPRQHRKGDIIRNNTQIFASTTTIASNSQNVLDNLKCGQTNSAFRHQDVPVFWVNLDNAVKRRQAFEDQLLRLGLKNKRISAVTPKSNIKYIREIVPRIMETAHELACVSSHLLAIYAAVHDTDISPSSPYALIIEDDVLFELDTNFTALAAAAPAGFGILQLMSSNEHQVEKQWGIYQEKMAPHLAGLRAHAGGVNGGLGLAPFDYHRTGVLPWTLWHQPDGLWSTQAYLINKHVIKRFINRVVSYPAGGTTPTIRLVSPDESKYPCEGSGLSKRCYFPWRMVADYYLYIGGGPTHFAQIPLFNGAKVNSTIHTHAKTYASHAMSFDSIARVIESAKTHAEIFPPYIRPFRCIRNNNSSI